MKDKIILAIPVVLVIFVALSFLLLGKGNAAAFNPPTSFTVNNSTYNFTAYALNFSVQEKGLMNTTVTNTTFMLFVFAAPNIYPYWMKNTYTQLDIIWIDAKNSTGRIVSIVNATPCDSYDPNQTQCVIFTPKDNANYVIETKYGFVEKQKLQIGDTVTFNFR